MYERGEDGTRSTTLLSSEHRRSCEHGRLVSSGSKYDGECTGFVKKIANLFFVRQLFS